MEVCISLGIAAVCMFGLQQMIPSSLRVAASSKDQLAAISMLNSITQDLKNTPSSSSASPSYGIPMPDLNSTNSTKLTSDSFYLSGAGDGVTTNSQARYLATVTMSNAAASTVSSLTSAHVKISWPANATGSNVLGSVETVTFFNRQFQRGGSFVLNTGGSAGYTLTGAASVTGCSSGPVTYGASGNQFTCSERDKKGYWWSGYGCDGYNSSGYDCNGYDRNGKYFPGQDCSAWDSGNLLSGVENNGYGYDD